MSALARMQAEFQRRILGDDASIDGAVISNEVADAAERMGVYTHAYASRLIEALHNDFPTLRFASGEDACTSMLRDYVAATPSTHRNVRWYGEGLAEFLRSQSPWKDTPALSELAALDWAIGLSFDSADQSVVSEQDIAALPPERWGEMTLHLSQHVRLHRCEWNVWAVRQAHDRALPRPSLRRLKHPQIWIVSRQRWDVHYRLLDVDEAAAIDIATTGAPFAQLCETLCHWHAQENDALRAAGLLKAWIGNGWIAAVALPD